MKPLLVLAFASLSFVTPPSQATTAPSFFEKTGTCSSQECCAFNTDWEVSQKTQVLDLADLKKVVAHLYPADKVRVLDSLTRSEKGIAQLKTATLDFRKGQQVAIYLMGADKEALSLWHNGDLIEIETEQIRIIKPSRFKNYIKLKTSSGVEGWVEASSLTPSC